MLLDQATAAEWCYSFKTSLQKKWLDNSGKHMKLYAQPQNSIAVRMLLGNNMNICQNLDACWQK
jgi:hypothetical protein